MEVGKDQAMEKEKEEENFCEEENLNENVKTVKVIK